MDKGKGKLEEIDQDFTIDEFIRELIPNNTATDIRTRRAGVSIRSSAPNNPINLEDHNDQVSPMTVSPMTYPSTNPGMWQDFSCIAESPNNSSCQNVPNTFAPTFNDFSNCTNNTVSNLHQPNMYHMSPQPNAYMRNRRQQQPPQQQPQTLQSVNPFMARRNQALFNHRPQNVILLDQVKQESQPQTTSLGPSQALFDSGPHESSGTIDWVSHTFQQIQKMKRLFLSDLTALHTKALELRPKVTSVEQRARCERHINFIERALALLNISQSSLMHCSKEPFYRTMHDTLKLCCNFRSMKSPPPNQTPPQHPELSTNHLQPPRTQQGCPRTGFDQNAIRMLLNPTNNSGVPHTTVNSSRNIVNSLDHSTGSINRPSSTLTPPQQRDAILGPQMRQNLGFNQIHHVNSPQNSPFPSPLTASSPSSGRNPLVLEESTNIPTFQGTGLQTESRDPGEKQWAPPRENPIQRLVQVLKRLSPQVLKSVLRDFDTVSNITDRIPGDFLPDEPKRFIIHDLADDIRTVRSCSESRIKRKLNATTVFNDSTAEMECNPSHRIKRLKNKTDDLLMEEIEEINRKLIEVAVEVKNVSGFGEETIVKCSYKPVGFTWNDETQDTSKEMFPQLILEIVVPADYPSLCPTVVEAIPHICSESEEEKHMWTKAKANFDVLIAKYSDKISLKQMCEAWNVCARKIFLEFAERIGGGSFSSRYEKWENVFN